MSETQDHPPHDYSPPVSDLLTLGRPSGYQVADWPDYITLYGFTAAHIPELGRLALDQTFCGEEYWERPEGYAFIHAFRALGQLRDAAALPYLIRLAETEEDSDWVWEELPMAVALIGAAALPLLKESLGRTNDNLFTGGTIVTCLEQLGVTQPETQVECSAILTNQLTKTTENDAGINANIIHALVGFRAMDSLPVIEQAFATDNVDLMVRGDWDDVLVDLGLKEPDPNKKRPPLPFAQEILETIEHINALEQAQIELEDSAAENRSAAMARRTAKAKQKAKRKQAKAQRRQNRKRRK